MRNVLFAALIAADGVAGCAATPGGAIDAAGVEASWDPVVVAQTVDAGRAARKAGDLGTAERLCYTAFQAVDRSALASYDAYADLLEAEHRPEAPRVREQAVRLREVKASQGRGTQPGSTYLGFAPADGLDAYAALLLTLDRPDASQRMRSLALAYRQVQQAHFERTMLFRQGKDPRGAC